MSKKITMSEAMAKVRAIASGEQYRGTEVDRSMSGDIDYRASDGSETGAGMSQPCTGCEATVNLLNELEAANAALRAENFALREHLRTAIRLGFKDSWSREEKALIDAAQKAMNHD